MISEIVSHWTFFFHLRMFCSTQSFCKWGWWWLFNSVWETATSVLFVILPLISVRVVDALLAWTPLVYLNEHVLCLLAPKAGMGYIWGFCTHGQGCALYNGNTNAHFLAASYLSVGISMKGSHLDWSTSPCPLCHTDVLSFHFQACAISSNNLCETHP